MIGTLNTLRLISASLIAGTLTINSGMVRAADEKFFGSEHSCNQIEEGLHRARSECYEKITALYQLRANTVAYADQLERLQERRRNLACARAPNTNETLAAADRAECLSKNRLLTKNWLAGLQELESRLIVLDAMGKDLFGTCGGAKVSGQDILISLPDSVRKTIAASSRLPPAAQNESGDTISTVDTLERALNRCREAEKQEQTKKASTPATCAAGKAALAEAQSKGDETAIANLIEKVADVCKREVAAASDEQAPTETPSCAVSKQNVRKLKKTADTMRGSGDKKQLGYALTKLDNAMAKAFSICEQEAKTAEAANAKKRPPRRKTGRRRPPRRTIYTRRPPRYDPEAGAAAAAAVIGIIQGMQTRQPRGGWGPRRPCHRNQFGQIHCGSN